MNRKVSIGFGAFALILTALVAIPQFINLESFKPKLEKRLTKALGQKVTIGGPISLSLLPNLGLKLNDVKVENLQWADDPYILSANEITASFSLLPLLSKTIEISQISFVEPTLNLQQTRSGPSNWEDFLSPSSGSDSEKSSSWSLSSSIPRIAVQKGIFKLQGGQMAFHVSDYQLSVKSISGSGPFVIQGHLFAEEHKIDYTINIGDTSADKVDVDTVFDSAVNHFQIKGKFDKASQTFNGNMGSRLNLERLTAGFIQDSRLLKMTADVTANLEQFALANIKGAAPDYQTTGQAVFTFTDGLSLDATIQDLPGKTKLIIKGPLTKLTSKPGDLQLMTGDIKALSEWVLKSSLTEKSEMPARLETKYVLSLDRLQLDQMKLNVADQNASGNAFFAWGLRHAIETKLNFDQGMIHLSAQYGQNLDDIKAELSFKHNQFGELLRALSPVKNLNIDDISLSLKASNEEKTLRLQDLKLQFVSDKKKSFLEGELQLNLKDEKPTFNALLNSQYLGLDTVFASQESDDWSDRQLWNSELFSGLTGTARLSVAKLGCYGLTFENVNIPVTVGENKLSAPITAVAGGAPFSARLTVEQASPWALKIDAVTNNANLNAFLGKSVDTWVTGGTVDADIKLKTVGLSPKSWVQNMRGSINLQASKGNVKGFDIQNVIKRVKALKALKDLVELLKQDKAVTPYDQISIQANFENGVAEMANLSLDGKFLTASAEAKIDLGNRILQLQGKGKLLKFANAPIFNFSTSGDLFSPETAFEGDELRNYLVHEFARDSVKSNLGKTN